MSKSSDIGDFPRIIEIALFISPSFIVFSQREGVGGDAVQIIANDFMPMGWGSILLEDVIFLFLVVVEVVFKHLQVCVYSVFSVGSVLFAMGYCTRHINFQPVSRN